MNTRLTQKQLTQVVAEVERLSDRRQGELDRQQVEEILQELNLPTDLLDEALVQLRRGEALEVQRRRQRWIFGGVAVVAVGAIASTALFNLQQQSLLSQVQVYQDSIALGKSDPGNLKEVDRRSGETVYYKVTLQNAPVGKKLSLRCDWIDPNGTLTRQNRWQTQRIDREVWQTYCRYPLNNAMITGRWQVRMFLGDRLLNNATFIVK
ncbi:MAG: DUF3859 domain-containing protein [Hormoscilla sp.]